MSDWLGEIAGMKAEDRAKAVVAYFPAIPHAIRGQVEDVVTRAIKRALNQQLAELEREAEPAKRRALGRGKSAKGRDDAAIYFHGMWADRFRAIRERGSSGLRG